MIVAAALLLAATPVQDRPASAAPAPGAQACAPEHAAMGHCKAAPAEAAPATPPPPPVPATYADRIWGAEAMRASRLTLRREHGGGRFSQLMIDRLELGAGDGAGLAWEADAWTGGDVHRIWVKSEGEREFGRDGDTDAEVSLLYGRAIDPYFDIQAGIRHDLGRGRDATGATIGIQGLAPYWFEVEAYLTLSTRGDLTTDLSAEYDQRLTQRLILQPRIEITLAAADSLERGTGDGLVAAEAGLRLRYEIAREFAPYVGIAHDRAFGGTARARRASGEDASATRLIVGVRMWL